MLSGDPGQSRAVAGSGAGGASGPHPRAPQAGLEGPALTLTGEGTVQSFETVSRQ